MKIPFRADDTPPATLAEGDFHQSTWQIMSLLGCLLEHGGWMSSSELGKATGLDRNAIRRMARTLEAGDWLRREQVDGSDLWTIGPELPRIGLQYAALLNRRMTVIRADFDRLSEPLRES